AGSRFLDHGVSIAEGGEAFVALPPVNAATVVEVVAVVAAPDGFRVHRAAAGESATAIAFEPEERPPVLIARALRVVAGEQPVPLAVAATGVVPGGIEPILLHADSATSLLLSLDGFRDRDAIVRAMAIPPGRAPVEAAARVLAPDPAPEAPAWMYEGDAPVPLGPVPTTTAFQLETRAFVPAGVPTEFPSDPPVPAEVSMFWLPIADPGSGSVRISAGQVVMAEGSFGGSVAGGHFPARHLADGPVVAVSDAAEFRGVLLLATFPARPETIRASDGRDLTVSSRLPGAVATGGEFDAVVTVRAAAPWKNAVEVRLPLPRGVVPAEDGWSIRERGPAVARVATEESFVLWKLAALPAGDTTLTVRLRAAYRGRWAAPPVRAATEDPAGPSAHGSGSVLVVE
ncbi:MAG TPA: hypothetical protein VFS92_04970, partial [Planctomycetota bacterium]|nr:hypothetical protein [Planctomycetota bacterium]